MILRDDHDDPWWAEADDTLERRVYFVQNWRHDVLALLGLNGRVQCSPAQAGDSTKPLVEYDPYGTPIGRSPADFTTTGFTSAMDGKRFRSPDGAVNSDDFSVFADLYAASAAAADMNTAGAGGPSHPDWGRPDGSNTPADFTYYAAVSGSAVGLGRGELSSGGLRNRRGMAGYAWDPVIGKYHVRHRVLDPATGRWLTRDPAGYVDGVNLHEYARSAPINNLDPTGLMTWLQCEPPRRYSLDELVNNEGGFDGQGGFGDRLGLILWGEEDEGKWRTVPWEGEVRLDFHVYGNWCGPNHGGIMTDGCTGQVSQQKCGKNGLPLEPCRTLSGQDECCRVHDACSYTFCYNYNPFCAAFCVKDICGRYCDYMFCQCLRKFARENPNMTPNQRNANWAMRTVFCRNNRPGHDGIIEGDGILTSPPPRVCECRRDPTVPRMAPFNQVPFMRP